MAHDGVAVLIEHRHLVVALDQALAAFVIEQDDVVCLVWFVVHDHAGTALAEGLDDFGGLGTRAAGAMSSESSVSAAGVAGHFPGLAVGDEDSGLWRRRCRCLRHRWN